MAFEIRILAQTEKTLPNEAGRFRSVIETRFMVGTDGPFVVQQDEATFDPAQQTALISAKAALVSATRQTFGG